VRKELIICGVSHHHAPLAVRERLAANPERTGDLLQGLLKDSPLSEGVLLSTCNRVEVIATTTEPLLAREHVLGYFNHRAAPDLVDAYVYERLGLEAVTHLFRVASGLDSMVLGEPQILGQVKEAFATASQHGGVGSVLSRCFDRSFGVAKRVRTETEVAAGNVSVSSIACELAERIFGELTKRKVLLVGAGKMSETAARSLKARGASLTVVNRSPERAAALAQACGGEAKPLESLALELANADVVITSTAKEGFVISYEMMSSVVKMRKWRQLFIIDIAVPRDVDPRVESLRNVFVYDMDDLKRVSDANLASRERAASAAQLIVAEEVEKYSAWLRGLELTPTIVALRERMREVVQREKQKTLPKLSGLTAQQQSAIEAMCDGIVGQLLHVPLTELKRSHQSDDGSQLVDAVQRLFKLEIEAKGAMAALAPKQDQSQEDVPLEPAKAAAGAGRTDSAR
jgi:glutamyl-tRNA reductase